MALGSVALMHYKTDTGKVAVTLPQLRKEVRITGKGENHIFYLVNKGKKYFIGTYYCPVKPNGSWFFESAITRQKLDELKNL